LSNIVNKNQLIFSVGGLNLHTFRQSENRTAFEQFFHDFRKQNVVRFLLRIYNVNVVVSEKLAVHGNVFAVYNGHKVGNIIFYFRLYGFRLCYPCPVHVNNFLFGVSLIVKNGRLRFDTAPVRKNNGRVDNFIVFRLLHKFTATAYARSVFGFIFGLAAFLTHFALSDVITLNVFKHRVRRP